MIKHFSDINDIHKDSTIYILGPGPSFGKIGQEDFDILKSKITIGLNNVVYLFNPNYFISGYPFNVFICKKNSPNTDIIFIKKAKAPDIVGTFPIGIRIFKNSLPKVLKEPKLISSNNIVFASMHLALCMGAKNIVLVGIEQKNSAHYYHYDETIKQKILSDMKLCSEEFSNMNHKYDVYGEAVERINISREEAEKDIFWKEDFKECFKDYLKILNSYGVRCYSVVKDSAAVDCGFEFIPLSKSFYKI